MRARSDLIAEKFARISGGESPRVLDLFSGCGGFSLGFQRADCRVIGGVEVDPDAARSHALNFHRELVGTPAFDVHAKPRDITTEDPIELVRELAPELEPQAAVDLLIGGPPCPAFARVGRAKLREISRHPTAFLQDPRAQLYVPYLKFVEALKPVGLVMENVPDILNYGGHNLAEEICEVLDDLGYRAAYTILNAANYGVPELRQRFLLIAWHWRTGLAPQFPEPTHHVDLPGGYVGSADVALRPLREAGIEASRWVDPPSQDGLDPVRDRAVSAEAALRDLPPITGHLDGSIGRGRRDLSAGLARSIGAESSWAREHMLMWPGLESTGSATITAHVIRALSWRDYRLFRRMEADDQYPEAYRIALDGFDEWLTATAEAGLEIGDDLRQTRRLADISSEAADALWQDADVLRSRGGLAGIISRWAALEKEVGAADHRRRAMLAALPRNAALGWPDDQTLDVDLVDRWKAISHRLGWVSAHPTSTELVREADIVRREARRVARLIAARAAWRAALDALGEKNRPTDRDLLPEGVDPLLAEADAIGTALEELSPPADMFWPEPALRVVLRAIAVHLIAFRASLDEFVAFKACFVPPYDPAKFPNKWRKMNPEEPARTLMAHLGKDSYSHIHYDSAQARTISVREAARLQSFPDAFRFSGTMNPGFRQVGNAVPPLLSFAVARHIVHQIEAGVPVAAQSLEAIG